MRLAHDAALEIMKPIPGFPAGLTRANRLLVGATLLTTAFVAGCSDRAQQVEEQVTELQRQVQALETQLDAAKREASSAKEQQAQPAASPTSDSTAAAAAPSEIPSKGALEASYEAASKKLREELVSKIAGMRVESCSTQSVRIHKDVYPFDSEVTLSLRSNDGKSYQLAVPVKADCAGKWLFPSSEEIVANINASKNETPVSEQAAASAARSESSSGRPRPPVMAIDGTINIQWPEDRRSSPPARRPQEAPTMRTTSNSAPATPAPTAPPAATPAPAPAQNRQPVMPVNRDVNIEFNR
jgi:outer membrane murein-binding lipoprotein Lpp